MYFNYIWSCTWRISDEELDFYAESLAFLEFIDELFNIFESELVFVIRIGLFRLADHFN